MSMTAHLNGHELTVPTPDQWRASALRALRQGDVDTWAEKTLSEADYDTWADIDPTFAEAEEFFTELAEQNPGVRVARRAVS